MIVNNKIKEMKKRWNEKCKCMRNLERGFQIGQFALKFPLDKRELEAILSNYVWILKWFYLGSLGKMGIVKKNWSNIWRKMCTHWSTFFGTPFCAGWCATSCLKRHRRNYKVKTWFYLEHPFVLYDVRPPVCKDIDAITG